MVDDGTLYRFAGMAGIVAVIALVVSAIALGLFFGGAGAVFGPVNDVAIAIVMVALILPIIAVDRVASPGVGAWLRVVTVAAIAGACLAAVGQLLLVAGVISLETSYVTGGLGIIPVLAWILACFVLSVPMGVLPASTGWPAGAVLLGSVIASVITAATSGPLAWVAWTLVVLALVWWLAALAGSLFGRAELTV